MKPVAFACPYYGEEEATAAADAVRSGWVVGGPRQAAFERRIAELCGAPHAVAASSWTTGAFLVLHAWGIGPGDEVIVPSLTFIASVNIIRHAGATPVFVDVDPRTWNIEAGDLERLVTTRTKAIIAIDQLGLPCDIDAVKSVADRHGLLVLQDAACSLGSRNDGRPVGSCCNVTVFSLHARKVVTTGEGGVIVTTDERLAERLRRLRHQGMSLSDYARAQASPTTFESYPEIGFNFRFTDIQAAIGLAQLERLDDILTRRAEIARRYIDHLRDHPLLVPPHVPKSLEPNWQSFQVAVRARSGLSRHVIMDALHARGVPTRRGVMASHLEEPYRELGARLPHTEWAAENCLQLPMHPALDDGQMAHILGAIDDLVGRPR